MAEKDKKVYSRELIGTTEWGREKKNNRRISIGLYGNSYYIQVSRPDENSSDNKFSKRKFVCFGGDMIEMAFSNAAKHIIRRIKAFEAGKAPKDSNPLVLYNGREINKSTMKAEFNVIKKEDKIAVLVKLIKYKKDEWDSPEWEDTFWFGNSSLYFKKEEKGEEDKKVFAFFEALEGVMRSCAFRTNLTRDRYIYEYLNAQKDDKSSSSSSSSSSDDDEEDVTYPF